MDSDVEDEGGGDPPPNSILSDDQGTFKLASDDGPPRTRKRTIRKVHGNKGSGVYLKADCQKCAVEIKQIGMNSSGFDGFAMSRGEVYNVGHNTVLEILLNNYKHVIEFEPPPNDTEPNTSKRKIDCEQSNPISKKSKMLSENEEPILITSESSWDAIDDGSLYIFTSKGVKSSKKIASFDMDGTLIKTKSGKVHPVDTSDWQMAFPTVAQKLKELIDDDFKVVIFSNQAAIGNGRVKISDFKVKIENIVKKNNIPIQVFLSTGKGFYRKPMIGMWEALIKEKNDNLSIDMSASFYCGDAAGRTEGWAPGKKKDHSMADRLFAENVGLKFLTPEQYFLGHSVAKVPISSPEFNPKEIVEEDHVDYEKELISNEKEILVLVGYPGSGKSFLAKRLEASSKHQYATVCRDNLGSWQKCASEAAKLLKQGKSVIVDSTNPDAESRARWTALAQESRVQCRCVAMGTSFAHARHNNKFREIMKIDHAPVNDMVFYSYKKKYVEPKTSEGFKEVIHMKFKPIFENEEFERKYKMHLLEK